MNVDCPKATVTAARANQLSDGTTRQGFTMADREAFTRDPQATRDWTRRLKSAPIIWLALLIAPGYWLDCDARQESAERISVREFSVETPSGKHWTVSVDRALQKITFGKSVQPGQSTEILVFRNTVAPTESGEELIAEIIADDFREYERSTMVRLGEIPGNYTLENVQNGESEVCGKKFYYMTFRQVFNEKKLGFPANIDGVMYLYFDAHFAKSGYFYVFVFKDFYRRDSDSTRLSSEQIDALLCSFEA